MFKLDTKILVVDDMLTMRKIISKQLKEFGFTNITEADDGIKAWPLIEQAHQIGHPFQLILSDWNMPQMKGIELLAKVRGDEKLKEVPFVLITAESEKTQVIEAVKLQVSNYIVKPFTSDQLKEKLETAHKKHNAPSSVKIA